MDDIMKIIVGKINFNRIISACTLFHALERDPRCSPKTNCSGKFARNCTPSNKKPTSSWSGQSYKTSWMLSTLRSELTLMSRNRVEMRSSHVRIHANPILYHVPVQETDLGLLQARHVVQRPFHIPKCLRRGEGVEPIKKKKRWAAIRCSSCGYTTAWHRRTTCAGSAARAQFLSRGPLTDSRLRYLPLLGYTCELPSKFWLFGYTCERPSKVCGITNTIPRRC